MRMKITLKKPKDEIIELVKFAGKDQDTKGIEIHIKNSKDRFRGRGGYVWYNGVVKMAKTSKYLATACINPNASYPYIYQIRQYGIDDILFQNWEECLIWLVAHELMHCVQVRETLRLSEKEACIYANGILEDWKKLNG